MLCARLDTPVNLQAVAARVQQDAPYLVWLDSARPHPVTGRFSVLGWDPWLVFTPPRHAHPLKALRELLARYPGPGDGRGLPPAGLGWLGLFGYELNRWIERLPKPKPVEMATPELMLLGMRALIVVDHVEGASWCVSVLDPHQPAGQARREASARWEQICALVEDAARDQGAPGDRAPVDSPSAVASNLSQAQFERMVLRAQAFIRAGEIFQANLAQQFSASWPGSPWALYARLRQVNPSPFACFVRTPDFSVVSCSPERLVRVQDGAAEARPIAGTRPRGATPQEDAVNSLELILSEKERAEHIMLVDLARNDLGRVCRAGSVRVDELMTLEEYSHVIHIVSNVRGRLQSGAGAVDVLRAVFPGGTITGCPKVRAMEIIRSLEPCGRGLYTGSCGWIGFDGSLDLNILIRTMVLQDHRLSFHAGAGIVADSQPDREYAETLAKAGALLNALVGSPVAADTSSAAWTVPPRSRAR